ncbi:hypothetical protein BDV30DRAFT_250200 [Aspergillus minisclerotigenes]|uniref:AAA+ ATPase domain-containing protein n=1 Tax=Aspergillus minisclerotigenes TaxID=656917 RepID=A0A5N6IXY5_9EURO|nr:hypothetical protein BDV30DRAFT_250200 [Aspergillus minisclerotigenes]
MIIGADALLDHLEHFTNPRADLVDELIARVHDYHIIRVIGPPASGKTTPMELMVNKLLEMNGPTKPIHVLTGWDKQEVCGTPGWARYLGQKTGVHREEWLSNPAYLLLDEAQQTYWDSELWASFFNSAGPGWSVFIVLFMSYGSPGEGLEGFEAEFISGLYLAQKPVGLLLDENEAMHVVTRYVSAAIQPSPSLPPDLKKGFFLTSSGHVRLLTSLTHVLHDVLELYDLVQRGVSIDWPTTSKILSSQPRKFFDLLSGYPFSKGLPTLNSLRDPITAQVFKTAIAHDGIYKASLRTGSKELKYALRDIWRNGWLHAVESNWDIRYIFASQIHRWYISSEPDIAIPLPLAAVEATTNLQPHHPPDMQAAQ